MSSMEMELDPVTAPPRTLATLPADIIECILDQMESLSTGSSWYTLLTVHRSLIEPCARRLYRSPFHIIGLHNNPQHVKASLHQLLLLVLRISPSQDPIVQALRIRHHSDLETLPIHPTIDYLTFMTMMNFASVNGWRDKAATVDSVVLDALVWAACGHRLSQVMSLSPLCFRYLNQRYLPHADKLANILCLDLILLCDPSLVMCEHDGSFMLPQVHDAVKLVTHIRVAAENAHTWTSSPPRINVDCINEPYSWFKHTKLELALHNLYTLLPPIHISQLVPYETHHARDWARFYLAPETVHLHCLDTIAQWHSPDGDMCIESHPFSKQGKAHVLQQCYNLSRLELEIEDAGEENIFCWTSEEANNGALCKAAEIETAVHWQGAPKLPPTKLKYLSLAARSTLEVCIEKPLSHAIIAWRQSLTSIHIQAWRCTVNLDIFYNMSFLYHLQLAVATVVCTGPGLVGCLRLERLELYDCDFDNADEADFVDTWSLPALHTLILQGPVAFRFNQRSFIEMPCLEDLTIKSDYLEQICTWGGYEMQLPYWRLPLLKRLELEGEMATSFRWSALVGHTMPLLTRISLTAPRDYPEEIFNLDEVFDLKIPLSAWHGPDVQEIVLNHWHLTDEDYLVFLPLLAPHLKRLSVEAKNIPDGWKQQQIMAVFKSIESITFTSNGYEGWN